QIIQNSPLIQSFQSTFPRGERHCHVYHLVWIYIISIHVPAWGTTRRWDVFMTMHVISIHVPAWGTTDGQNDRPADGRSISIHVPAWGTTNIHARRIPCCCISIHVPAWGTTLPCIPPRMDLYNFNPR